MTKRTTLITSLIGLAALALAQNGITLLESRMNGSIAGGKAKYKLAQRAGRQLQEELEVEGEDLMANSEYTININGKAVRTVTTDAFGSFEWEARSVGLRRYLIQNGSSVSVSNSNGIVMSGTFAPRP